MGNFKLLMISMLCWSTVSPCIKASADVVWSQSFDDESSLDGFTLLNVNEDDGVWKWSEKRKVAMYNGDKCVNQADDWLITPALKLISDSVYSFKYLARSFSPEDKETLGIYIGKSADPECMTTVIMGPQLLQSNEKLGKMMSYIRVPDSGEWYIGFHAMSEAAQGYLIVDDLEISPFCHSLSPSKPEIAVAPGENGRISSDILAVAPTLDITGTKLGGTVNLVVLRQRHDHYDVTPCECPVDTIWQKNGVEPGSQHIISDSSVAQGFYTYYIEASNESGTSPREAYNALVGTDIPGAVTNPSIVRNEQGIVTLSWEAPKRGMNGGYIKKSDLTYSIEVTAGNNWVALEDGLSDCQYAFDLTQFESEVKELFQFRISAKNQFGVSEGVVSPFFTSGKPYALPYHDSFDISSGNLEDMPIWVVPDVNYSHWQLMNGIGHDEDQFCSVAYMGSSDVTLDMLGAEIDLSNAVEPVLEFWYYHTPDYGSPLLSTVVSAEYGAWETVDEIALNPETSTSEWEKVTIPLKNFAGKKWIQFGFRAYSNTPLDMLMVDDITLSDKTSGIFDLPTDDDSFKIHACKGYIEVLGNGEVSVVSYDGSIIYSGSIDESASISCAPGIYIVRAGSMTRKVIVL